MDPTILGAHDIVERIGEGGIGEVALAGADRAVVVDVTARALKIV
jgi:hypothetical protein